MIKDKIVVIGAICSIGMTIVAIGKSIKQSIDDRKEFNKAVEELNKKAGGKVI